MQAMARASAALAAAVRSDADARFADQRLLPYDRLSPAIFEPWIGTEFDITAPSSASATLTLLSVQSFSATASAAQPFHRGRVVPGLNHTPAPIRGFYLQFQGAGNPLPQDTYTLNSSGFGKVSVFLVPSSRTTPIATYTAVFAFVP